MLPPGGGIELPPLSRRTYAQDIMNKKTTSAAVVLQSALPQATWHQLCQPASQMSTTWKG